MVASRCRGEGAVESVWWSFRCSSLRSSLGRGFALLVLPGSSAARASESVVPPSCFRCSGCRFCARCLSCEGIAFLQCPYVLGDRHASHSLAHCACRGSASFPESVSSVCRALRQECLTRFARLEKKFGRLLRNGCAQCARCACHDDMLGHVMSSVLSPP